MAHPEATIAGGHPDVPAGHMRTDAWWVGPLLTFLGLSAFIVYATWAALQGNHYYAEPYLSPMYSPVVFTNVGMEGVVGAAPLHHSWFGAWPGWWPAFMLEYLPASPAFFILAFPGAMRFTCYYYRKAYYRSFAGSPPGCAVVAIPKNKDYKGETGLLVIQNLHRYALYFAICFIFIHYYDAWLAFWKLNPATGVEEFGVGVGTFVIFTNATLLGAYTFGCHSLRHLVGGRHDCMTCGEKTLRFTLWKKVTVLNDKHMLYAWCSLFWVGFTDFYVRMVSMGKITDFNTWGF